MAKYGKLLDNELLSSIALASQNLMQSKGQLRIDRDHWDKEKRRSSECSDEDIGSIDSCWVDSNKQDVYCARPLSFHRHMCWCNEGFFTNDNGDKERIEGEGLGKKGWCEETVRANSNSNSNSNGHCKSQNGRSLLENGSAGTKITAPCQRTSKNYSNLCCCMCGSMCPAECHACFHVVCKEYSGQHLCQWADKGHALPGAVFDKDKVS